MLVQVLEEVLRRVGRVRVRRAVQRDVELLFYLKPGELDLFYFGDDTATLIDVLCTVLWQS